MWPKALEERRWITGSRTMSSVPITVRMISGRKRTRSPGFKKLLTGTRHLRLGPGLHLEGHIDLGLAQHTRGGLADRRQERLRIDAHPHHHGDQRNDDGPFAEIQIWEMRADLFADLAVE